jgi:hypothetical protein
MAGTVKFADPPELEWVGELDACAEAVELTGGFGASEGVAGAEVAGVEVAGVEAGADAGDDPPLAVDTAAAEPPEAGPDAASDGVDPLPPHAVRPAPPMTAAISTTGTPRILMLLLLQRVTNCYSK